MSKNLFKNPRKTIAIALVGLGLAGVSIASAATLQLNGGNSSRVQAGVDDLTYSTCQGSVIDVYYSVDDGNGHGAGHLVSDTGVVDDFGYVHDYDVLVLDAFDPACGDKNLKVAIGGSQGELLLQYEGTVPVGGGLVTLDGNAPWTVGDNVGPDAEVAKVAVTIYD